MSKRPMLDASDLNCRRGGSVLFAGVSCALRAGDLLLVRGANGAGKTSLLRLLAGLADGGGRVVRTAPVLWIGHAPGVTWQLSARENLQLFCALENVAASGVDGALADLHLAAHADRLCSRLSEGQRRRVALARLALSACPLWLLDEPLTALDEASVAWVEAQIARHRAAGGAVALATHRALRDADGARTLELG